MNVIYCNSNRTRATAHIIVIFFALTFNSGCKKMIEVEAPYTSLNAGNVYTNDQTAVAVLTNIYAEMSEQNSSMSFASNDITSVSLFAGLGADELVLFDLNNANLRDYYQNDLTVTSSPNFFDPLYSKIYVANNALEGLRASTTLTPSIKRQLIGEALFIRAFAYFYLVTLYGDVPLILNTDWKSNLLLYRTNKERVFEQILNDLTEAKTMLADQYLAGDLKTVTGDRVRPTKWAASALLARIYLHVNDWVSAEKCASEVISNTSLFNVHIQLEDVFKKNSLETIWALQPVAVTPTSNTGEGRIFILGQGGPNSDANPVCLSDFLINSFEAGDSRAVIGQWVDSIEVNDKAYYFSYKYKLDESAAVAEEYPIVLRLSEQYLIRAEARAQQNLYVEAQGDLNVIRVRAGLRRFDTSDKGALLAAILRERQVELFTEWGHRWLDLKRTSDVNTVMSLITPVKANGSPWRSNQALYPIPQDDLNRNLNLMQNEGY